MLKAVTETNGRLAADGHQFLSKVVLKMRKQAGIETPPPDVPDILAKAELAIANARQAADKQDYALAWAEARRAKRALRMVMRGHWDQAWLAFLRAAESINPEGPKAEDEAPKRVEKNPKVKLDAPLLIAPISCPPLISFYTLPEHYIWVDWIKGRPGYRFGPNRVPSGDFEDPVAMTADGWVDVSYQMDGFKSDNMKLRPRKEANGNEVAKNKPNRDQLSPDNAHSKHVVMLQVEAEDPNANRYDLTEVLRLPDRRDSLASHSCRGKQPDPDFRPGQTPLRECRRIGRNHRSRLDRRRTISVPVERADSDVLARGSFPQGPRDRYIWVMLGLAGYEKAYFDDFRVEVIEEDGIRDDGGRTPDNIVQQPRGRTSPSPRLPAPTLPGTASLPSESRPR